MENEIKIGESGIKCQCAFSQAARYIDNKGLTHNKTCPFNNIKQVCRCGKPLGHDGQDEL